MNFALVDGNNFYVSCERAFNPALEGKPVVVPSNNDGCVVARSAEVKGLGVRMGAPWLRCNIVVTGANAFMKPLHDLPVILAQQDYARWLDPDNHDTASLKQLLIPAPEDWLIEWPVSRALNPPRHEGPNCAERPNWQLPLTKAGHATWLRCG